MTTFHVKFRSLPEPVQVEILELLPPPRDPDDPMVAWGYMDNPLYRVRLPDGRTTRVAESRIIVRDAPRPPTQETR